MSRPFGQTHRTRGLAAYRPGVDACQRLLLPQVAVAYFFHVYGYRPLSAHQALGSPLPTKSATRHWFRLMSDPHEQFCWTSRWCRVMLLRRAISLSSGGDDDDIDPHAMPLLSWEKRRGPAHLHHTMWRTSDPISLCPLCTVFFRNTPYPHCPVENPHCPCGASPCSPHRRGRDQRCDTAVWCEQK